MCDRLTGLRGLTRAGYSDGSVAAAGTGLVCLKCLADLPRELYANGKTFLLICHAP